MKRFYKRNIVEGKWLLYFSVLFAVAVRLLFYNNLTPEKIAHYQEPFQSAYLWELIAPFFHNHILISCILSFGAALLISLYLLLLNKRFTLIREKTNLLFTISLMLLSIMPQLLLFSPQMVAVICFLMAVNKLYESYQSHHVLRLSFDIGFYIIFGSLFSTDIFLYFVFFWIGFSFMRSFTFKAIFTSLISLVLIYWMAIVIFYFMAQNHIAGITFENIYQPFTNWLMWSPSEYGSIFADYTWIDASVMVFNLVLLCIMFVNNYAENFKDKIRVRANINWLLVVLVFSVLFYVFYPMKSYLSLLIALSTSSIVVSRFFALASKSWQIYMFYICIEFFITYAVYVCLTY